MSYLIRKISRSKWVNCDENVAQTITADAVTNCLKTTKNTLSVWFAEQESDIENAKIAMLAALEKFDSVDLLVLKAEDLVEAELELVESDGDTIAKPFVKLHRDISTLSLVELEKVAKIMQRRIVAGETERITRGKFQQIIKKAIADEIIMFEDLPDKMSVDLK